MRTRRCVWRWRGHAPRQCPCGCGTRLPGHRPSPPAPPAAPWRGHRAPPWGAKRKLVDAYHGTESVAATWFMCVWGVCVCVCGGGVMLWPERWTIERNARSLTPRVAACSAVHATWHWHRAVVAASRCKAREVWYRKSCVTCTLRKQTGWIHVEISISQQSCRPCQLPRLRRASS